MSLNRTTKVFILVGLLVALILAIFISPFASSLPDGLEKVAEDIGFLEKGESSRAWKFSPIPDYVVPGLGEGALATAVAGLVGTIATLLIGWGLASLLRRRSKNRENIISDNLGKEKKLQE